MMRVSKEDVLLFGCYGMRGSGKSYIEKLKEKDKEIERLNNIINKAIEYIKAVGVIPKNIDIFVLLDILKGVDKEWK